MKYASEGPMSLYVPCQQSEQQVKMDPDRHFAGIPESPSTLARNDPRIPVVGTPALKLEGDGRVQQLSEVSMHLAQDITQKPDAQTHSAIDTACTALGCVPTSKYRLPNRPPLPSARPTADSSIGIALPHSFGSHLTSTSSSAYGDAISLVSARPTDQSTNVPMYKARVGSIQR